MEGAVHELERQGLPLEAIRILPDRVASTYDEAVALRREASERHFRRLLIVTSAYHSRRALWTFRRVFAQSGVEVGIEPVAPGLQASRPGLWWLTPRGWRDVAGEYPKLAWYLARYR